MTASYSSAVGVFLKELYANLHHDGTHLYSHPGSKVSFLHDLRAYAEFLRVPCLNHCTVSTV